MLLRHHSTSRPSMKTSKLVCILGLALVAGLSLERVQGKRQNPSHDEIERVINDTHSVILKCSTCHPGFGLSVQCGTIISKNIPMDCVPCVKGMNYSITQDYSTCKSCRNCAKHENKRGECTPEEDTTECLGTCYKGFYMDKTTEDCHSCSECCNNLTAKKFHEKQCEDSGLPPNQQCRQSNTKCPHPSKPTPTPSPLPNHPDDDDEQGSPGFSKIPRVLENTKCPHPSKPTSSPLPNHPDDEQGSPGFSKITLLMIILLAVFLLLLLLVYYGWEKIRSLLIKWCCSQPVLPIEWNNVDFHAIDLCVDGVEDDSEATNCNFSGSLLTEGGDVLTHLSSLQGGKTNMKRPMFQRFNSVPVETQSKSEIPRSSSDPGALNDPAKLDKLKETLTSKSGFKTPHANKHTKKGYIRVATEMPMTDDLPSERVDRVTSFSPIERFSVGADDIMIQESDNEIPAPPKLLEIDDLPVENHDKDCHINPASRGAVPGDSMQSAGSMGKDLGLQNPAVTDQCTSTTELHLSSAKEVSDIPQDFLDYCLRKRMLDIPIEFHRKICMMLDIPRDLHWDDYRMLAQKIGLTTDDISWLGQQNNKTELILQKFDTQKDPSIRRFKAILDEMERNDVVAVIEEWIRYEWSKVKQQFIIG